MKLDTIIKLLMPKDKFFFEMIEKSCENLVRVANEFRKFADLKGNGGVVALAARIKDLEHDGDKTTYHIFEELNKTFLTPLDREDIREITGGIDDIIDIIDSTSAKIVLYKIIDISPEMKQLMDIIVKSTEEIRTAISQLRKIHHGPNLRDLFRRIHILEEEGDRIYRNSIADLFNEERDPITLVKMKEIYEAIERTIDKCKVTGDVIETVFMKNS
jgi:uncharacterized protein